MQGYAVNMSSVETNDRYLPKFTFIKCFNGYNTVLVRINEYNQQNVVGPQQGNGNNNTPML